MRSGWVQVVWDEESDVEDFMHGLDDQTPAAASEFETQVTRVDLCVGLNGLAPSLLERPSSLP